MRDERAYEGSGGSRPQPAAEDFYKRDHPRAIDHYIDYFGGGGAVPRVRPETCPGRRGEGFLRHAV
ncbi:MAG TPA: hypothetical protein VNN07_19325 [Candidatus Tectomicrobia bacterium]|nr:hypothetical protein [Candidatus Tectomicrobia bacterium]